MASISEEKSLSVVATLNPAASSTATPTSATTTTATSGSLPNPPLHSPEADNNDEGRLDFVGTGLAVKKLFNLPYANDVSLAIHNVQGTLLIDVEASSTDRTRNADDSPNNLLPQSLALVKKTSQEGEGSSASAIAQFHQALTARQGDVQAEKTSLHPISENGNMAMPSPPNVGPVSQMPREYLPWKFHDMNLLIGSDALIVREKASNTNAAAVCLRVEDAKELRSLQQQVPPKSKSSYAQVLKEDPQKNKMSSMNLDSCKLQSCIVPSSPLDAVLGSQTKTSPPTAPLSGSSDGSPVAIVLDAYLDNLMANVPQLALCLRENGVVQSIKLMQTEDIPSLMLQPQTLDTSQPIQIVTSSPSTGQDENIFSPQEINANAGALLRFLKLNCTRDNATYLFQKTSAGDDAAPSIQLFDISSISQQRQRKWNWWLATMSYRFALKLSHLEKMTPSQAFRHRQRSLCTTTLELLEELSDMDGSAHESFAAAVHEHMADTFLIRSVTQSTSTSQESKLDLDNDVEHQPYSSIPVDSLNKAQDHLTKGIKALQPIMKGKSTQSSESLEKQSRRRARSDSLTKDFRSSDINHESTVMQLLGLNHKDINVSLRLAEHHLKNYFSSSAMQALRNAARRMEESRILSLSLRESNSFLHDLRSQFGWLWEHCGHFARSFASDELWRDRGHACGDDIVSVLRDVEAACSQIHLGISNEDSGRAKRRAKERINLTSLSAIIGPKNEAAESFMAQERQIQREKRQVLVAACVSYERAILSFKTNFRGEENDEEDRVDDNVHQGKYPAIVKLLRQRLGDAQNETGKVMLSVLRRLLSTGDSEQLGGTESKALAAEAFLSSARFWFNEGLETFEACDDRRNQALLRCNLCQCSKLRANTGFKSRKVPEGVTHAEVCLQEAAEHLQKAHEALVDRDEDQTTWDMVSEELAATFLVLGVRRRQNLLGGGAAPVILQSMRLSPGQERTIVDPMEQALKIYKQLGNWHQAAAAHYQLALTFSKVWTCQRDETKTREKLSAAFQHYSSAFGYFKSAMRGNETTFCLLCLDLASLYSAVSGEEGLNKALSRCLDTVEAFAQDSFEHASTLSTFKEWKSQMCTLASSVEERVFKLLRTLAQMDTTNASKYKDLYRVALTAKMESSLPKEDIIEEDEGQGKLLTLHSMMEKIKTCFDEMNLCPG